MYIRVPLHYESELVYAGCAWAEEKWAWLVPLSAEASVLSLLSRIEASGERVEILQGNNNE